MNCYSVYSRYLLCALSWVFPSFTTVTLQGCCSHSVQQAELQIWVCEFHRKLLIVALQYTKCAYCDFQFFTVVIFWERSVSNYSPKPHQKHSPMEHGWIYKQVFQLHKEHVLSFIGHCKESGAIIRPNITYT